MDKQTVPIGVENVKRRLRRDTLCDQVRSLRDLLLDEDPSVFRSTRVDFGLPALKVEASHCDGDFLLLTWEFDGSEDIEFPLHSHNGIHEHTALVTQGRVLFKSETGIEKVLKNPGDFFYAKPNEAHSIWFLAEGGSARGWTTFQPPDMDAIPSDSAGNCALGPLGRCSGDPTVCSYSRVRALSRQGAKRK